MFLTRPINYTTGARAPGGVTLHFAWLETPDGAAAATLRTTALATGFIGLAAADLIDEWSTFVR